MAVVHIRNSYQDEGEGVADLPLGGCDSSATNPALTEYVRKFVSSEVAGQFQNEKLADQLKGKNMLIMSASWG